MIQGTVVSVNTSVTKGRKKSPTEHAVLIAGQGILGDAHAGDKTRQVSLLASESIDKARAAGLSVDSGDFAENITCSGLQLTSLPTGSRLVLISASGSRSGAILQISQIGKVCHTPCHIGRQLGDCVMPREGVFAQVACGGQVSPGDTIEPVFVLTGAVVVVKDTAATDEDDERASVALRQLLLDAGFEVAACERIVDDHEAVVERVQFLAENCCADVILMIGTPRCLQITAQPETVWAESAIDSAGVTFSRYERLAADAACPRPPALIVSFPGSRKDIPRAAGYLSKSLSNVVKSIRGFEGDCGKDAQH